MIGRVQLLFAMSKSAHASILAIPILEVDTQSRFVFLLFC